MKEVIPIWSLENRGGIQRLHKSRYTNLVNRVLRIGDEMLDKFDFELDNLYNKYRKLMFNKAFIAFGNKELAEDIVQDVFVSMIRNKKSLYFHNNKKALLFASLNNRIKSEYRYQSRQRKLMDNLIITYNPESRSEFDISDIKELLTTYLNSNDAMVLFDFYIKGKAIQLICEELSLSQSGVKMRLSRAKKKLIIELSKQGDFQFLQLMD